MGEASATRWDTLLAIDFDRWAAETYRANFPGVRVECGPVSEYIDKLPDADVILGGPPCQPFSLAGEGIGASDKRNAVPDFVAAVRRVKPRQFLMENVPGLLNQTHRKYLHGTVSELESFGYHVGAREMDAVSYGVPQFRKRLWLWGVRKDVLGYHWIWPPQSHAWPPQRFGLFNEYGLRPGVTVRQALGIEGMLHRRRGKSVADKRRDHPCDEPSPSITAAFALGGGGGLFLKSTGPLAVERTLNKPSPTISAGSHCGGPEPVNNRKREGFLRRLTPLECFRLQSGPDDFVWPTGITKTAMYRIVGNGWASRMAAAMGRALAAMDPASRTVIDLFCGGGLGACGWHQRFWSFEREEASAA